VIDGAAAVIGTGFIGPVHVEALRRLGIDVRGVLGSTPDKSLAAAGKLGLARGYASLDELLADDRVAVVHVASPNNLHDEHCRKVLAAGRHVICEKPLANTTKQTGELVQLAARSGKVAAVNYNVRYYPLCVEARERIRRGDIGRVRHITGFYHQDWLMHETDFNWRVLRSEAGDTRAVGDIGTHWMDLVCSVAALEVESLCADLSTFLPVRKRPVGSVETFQSKTGKPANTVDVNVDTEDYGAVLLRFAGGAAGAFTVSQVAAGEKNSVQFSIVGSLGSITWDGRRPNELILGHRDKPNEVLIKDPALMTAAARGHADYPGGHAEGFPDTFKQLYKSVYGYIAAGDFTAPAPFPTFADGHREVRLCEAIVAAHRSRRWVELTKG